MPSGLTGRYALGSFQPQAGFRNMLYCATSMLTPAGSTTPLLSRTSLTATRLRELAATGCSLMLSCSSSKVTLKGTDESLLCEVMDIYSAALVGHCRETQVC